MIEDHYEASIMPTAIHLRTADGSPMSLIGKSTLLLWIADFKFSHTLIFCNRSPETDFLFDIDLEKQCSLSYCWDSNKYLFIQREGSFLAYTRNREDLHNVAVVISTLKIPSRNNGSVPIRIKGHNLKDKWHILSAINTPRRTLTHTPMYLKVSTILKAN